MSEHFHKIFPEIPRYDNEPPLEGLPQSPEESAFLSIPELSKTADLATDFDKANSDKKRKTIDHLIVELIENPDRFIQTLDALALLKEVNIYKTELLEKSLEHGWEHIRFKKFPPSPESLNGWLTILAESDLYRPLAEKVLKQMVDKCNSNDSVITLLYELSLVGLRSNNSEIVKKTLEILAFQTKILPPDSLQTIYYLLGNFDLSDDIIRKTFEVDTTFAFLSEKHGTDLMQRKVEANGIIAENPRFNERLKKIYDADPSRCKKLQELLHKNDVDGIGLAQWEAETIDPDQFPFNILVQQIGPLRKWYNHQIAMEYQNMKGASAISLHLPKMSAIFQANEHLAHVIQTAMFQENTNGKILEEEDYWDTLSYLVPPQIQEKEQLAALIETNQFLQRDIRNNTRYLLSPRGDLIEITDNILKSLGFQSILYEMDNRNRRDTIVTVKVGNFEYRILLDEYLSLRETKSRKTLHLPLSAHFVTNIILSHLREIRCSEKVNDINGGTNGGEGARRAFTARRPHLRHLPTGQKPTTEQIQRALTTYDIDIIRINREAETRGENRKITFVFEAQNIVIVGQGPVHSRAPEATKKLQEILNR